MGSSASGGAGAGAAEDDDRFTYCVGSPTWRPQRYIADAELHARARAHLEQDDFYAAIAESFSLAPFNGNASVADKAKRQDTYVYHAIMSVTLAQVQHAVSLGRGGDGGNGTLHAWYRDPSPEASQTPRPHPNPPSRQDSDAYVAIFDAATATPAALRGFAANARKGSVRAAVADHLLAKRYLHPTLPGLQIPKVKPSKGAKGKAAPATDPTKDPYNPYLDFAAWSCRNLEWCGPCGLSEAAPGAAAGHPVLPVLMHHFGCACPSREALEILKVLAAGRGVIDAGSGGGYWTFMLRQHGLGPVTAVDSAQSAWRATWVQDTVVDDAARWLRRQRPPGCPDQVLLVVYPIVGGGVAGGEEGSFTKGLLRAYAGDTLAIVGTQNRNGYTSFRGRPMDEYMAAEQSEWTKVVQIPLPSFPGKDEALFVFQRGERAPKKET